MSNSLWPHGLYSPWNSPGQNTGVGSLSLLQGIFPTQGLNPGLPHCRQILYQLSHQGSPQLLEWIAYPFSRGICQTQKLKWGLIHCRRILYQLSHQGYIPDKNTPEPWQQLEKFVQRCAHNSVIHSINTCCRLDFAFRFSSLICLQRANDIFKFFMIHYHFFLMQYAFG